MKTLKVLLTISFLVIFTFGSFAQRKTVTTLSTTAVNNATPVYTDSLMTKLADQINFQLVFTQTGGTSDGAAYMQASVDGTSWSNITEKDGLTSFFSNDTLTIVNGAIWNVVVKDNPWKYIRFKFVGTANDSTSVVTKYTIAN